MSDLANTLYNIINDGTLNLDIAKDLSEYVIVGANSAGKSTVVCELLQNNVLYTNDGTGTVIPMSIKIRNGKNEQYLLELPEAAYYNCQGGGDCICKNNRRTKINFLHADDVVTFLRQLQEHMKEPRFNIMGSLTITHPNVQMSLSLGDTPGPESSTGTGGFTEFVKEKSGKNHQIALVIDVASQANFKSHYLVGDLLDCMRKAAQKSMQKTKFLIIFTKIDKDDVDKEGYKNLFCSTLMENLRNPKHKEIDFSLAFVTNNKNKEAEALQKWQDALLKEMTDEEKKKFDILWGYDRLRLYIQNSIFFKHNAKILPDLLQQLVEKRAELLRILEFKQRVFDMTRADVFIDHATTALMWMDADLRKKVGTLLREQASNWLDNNKANHAPPEDKIERFRHASFDENIAVSKKIDIWRQRLFADVLDNIDRHQIATNMILAARKGLENAWNQYKDTVAWKVLFKIFDDYADGKKKAQIAEELNRPLKFFRAAPDQPVSQSTLNLWAGEWWEIFEKRDNTAWTGLILRLDSTFILMEQYFHAIWSSFFIVDFTKHLRDELAQREEKKVCNGSEEEIKHMKDQIDEISKAIDSVNTFKDFYNEVSQGSVLKHALDRIGDTVSGLFSFAKKAKIEDVKQ